MNRLSVTSAHWSYTALKLLAVITMTIDHVGYIFFPEYIWMRLVGRLAFPIFAFLIATGALHTSNIKHYIVRLYIFAFIAQVPYALTFNAPYELNVLFTLATGLVALWAWKRSTWYGIGATVILSLIAENTFMEYGAFGVWSIVLFYLAQRYIRAILRPSNTTKISSNTAHLHIKIIGLYIFITAITSVLYISLIAFAFSGELSVVHLVDSEEYNTGISYITFLALGILAIPFCFLVHMHSLCTTQRRADALPVQNSSTVIHSNVAPYSLIKLRNDLMSSKYLFYWYYPVHLLVIFMLMVLFNQIL